MDVGWVQGYLCGRQMVEVPSEVLWRWLVAALDYLHRDEQAVEKMASANKYLARWSDGTLDLFLRTRMAAEGFLRAGGFGQPVINLPVELHTGVTNRWPSDLETARLQRWRRVGDEDQLPGMTATPGMGRSQAARLVGVDCVARRVAPTDAADGQ